VRTQLTSGQCMRCVRDVRETDDVRVVMARNQTPLVSTPFESVDYYVNIRKCLTASNFMHVAHLEQRRVHVCCVHATHSARAQWALFDCEGQSGGDAAPVTRPRPQARMGRLQRTCAHNQELHQVRLALAIGGNVFQFTRTAAEL
jgi:hypothetical protein